MTAAGYTGKLQALRKERDENSACELALFTPPAPGEGAYSTSVEAFYCLGARVKAVFREGRETFETELELGDIVVLLRHKLFSGPATISLEALSDTPVFGVHASVLADRN